MRPQRGKIHTLKCATRKSGSAAAPSTLMVERWVKSAVSPDWTVILGWGTFWIPVADPASATTHHAAVETTLLSWKSGVPLPDFAFSAKNILPLRRARARPPLRTSLSPCGIPILLRQRALGNFDGTKDR